MAEPDGTEALIRELSERLSPVRRLSKPWLRALLWLAACAAMVCTIFAIDGPDLLMNKLSHGPDEVMEFVGAAVTAATAGLAAFTLAVPGRPARWALLPIPSLLLWVLGGGWGCWRIETVGYDPATLHPPMACFQFILLMSVPLSLLLFVMLRRSFSVRPALTATLAGLAAAAAAATLLDLVHPFEVTVPDLAAHAAAVLVVVGLNRVFSMRGLTRLALIAMILPATHAAMAEPPPPAAAELFTPGTGSFSPAADALFSSSTHTRR